MKLSSRNFVLSAFLVSLAIPAAAQSQSRADTIEYLVRQCVSYPFARTGTTARGETRTHDPRSFTFLDENFGILEATTADNVSFSIPLSEVQFSMVGRGVTFSVNENGYSSRYDVDVVKVSCSDGGGCVSYVDRYDGQVSTGSLAVAMLPCRQAERAVNALEHLQETTSDPFQ